MTIAKHNWAACAICGKSVSIGDEIIGDENMDYVVHHARCHEIPREQRYAVAAGKIRTGFVVYGAFGQAVDWGHGPNLATPGFKTEEEAQTELDRLTTEWEGKKRREREMERPHIEMQDALIAARGYSLSLGYIISGVYPRPVTTSNAKNLVINDQYRSFVAYRGQPWPTIYPTQEAAEAAIQKRIDGCMHEWQWLSHEEQQCTRCGDFRVIPDM